MHGDYCTNKLDLNVSDSCLSSVSFIKSFKFCFTTIFLSKKSRRPTLFSVDRLGFFRAALQQLLGVALELNINSYYKTFKSSYFKFPDPKLPRVSHTGILGRGYFRLLSVPKRTCLSRSGKIFDISNIKAPPRILWYIKIRLEIFTCFL